MRPWLDAARRALAACLLAGCAAGAALPPSSTAHGAAPSAARPVTEGAAPPAKRVRLRVALFPWVPEPRSLFEWIERDFEQKNPDIDLVVLESGRAAAVDFPYSVDRAADALGGGADAQDVIEVDTVALSALRARGVIVPFDIRGPTYLPFTREAVQLHGETFGVPHWTCGYFVISENPAIRGAKTVTSLLAVLGAEKSDKSEKLPLVGELGGSWDSIFVYLDSVRDSDPGRDLVADLRGGVLDAAALTSLEAIGAACTKEGKSSCDLDGSALLASRKAAALLGFSERLHPVLTRMGSARRPLHVASAPLGAGSHPTLFTDALVLAAGCGPECRSSAERFAAYYVSDETFETALMGKDTGPGGPPRYLLPSTVSAFAIPAVHADPLYRQLEEEIAGARPFPNEGIPEVKRAGILKREVRKRLGLPN